MTHSVRSSLARAAVYCFHAFSFPSPVAGPPETSADYLDRYVAQEDDTVKLLCPIAGNPKPIIEWYQVSQVLH